MVVIDNNNNNKYISRALNPSVSNLREAQSAAQVQLKLSKVHYSIKNQANKETSDVRKQTHNSQGWADKGARSKQQVNNSLYIT